MVVGYRVRMLSDEAVELGTRAARLLAGSGCRVGPGLTEGEFARIEQEYGFEFADDHRAFLAAGLPLNTPRPTTEGVYYTHAAPWPDWRDGDPESLRKALGWPVEGVLFDVRQYFWFSEWGTKPADVEEAVEVAKSRLASVPQMVPLYGHRYLPPGRGTYGHPVLSMYQTDIICYGADLANYVQREFGGPEAKQGDGDGDGDSEGDAGGQWNPRPTVPFWSELM